MVLICWCVLLLGAYIAYEYECVLFLFCFFSYLLRNEFVIHDSWHHILSYNFPTHPTGCRTNHQCSLQPAVPHSRRAHTRHSTNIHVSFFNHFYQYDVNWIFPLLFFASFFLHLFLTNSLPLCRINLISSLFFCLAQKSQSNLIGIFRNIVITRVVWLKQFQFFDLICLFI